jgi:hypothetical protein
MRSRFVLASAAAEIYDGSGESLARSTFMKLRSRYFGCSSGLLLIICLALGLATRAMAKPGVIHTTDGRTIEGDINENPGDPESVGLTSHGVTILIPRRSVMSIDYADNFQDDFKKRMAKLGAADVKGRLEVAQWALDQHQYDAAHQATEDALKIDPYSINAKQMMEIIDLQKKLDEKAKGATPVVVAAADTPAPKPASRPDSNIRLLSADDINVIRQTELRNEDSNARIQFLHDVKNRFLATANQNSMEFNSKPALQQALDILGASDQRLVVDVRISSDPASMSEFKTRILPQIRVGCASSGCHGGDNGGGFFLYNSPDAPAVWYTDFYILQNFQQTSPGVIGAAGGNKSDSVLRMIDRTHPTDSLLLQYGLPQAVATHPHPKSAKWRPIFSSDRDAGYVAFLKWIGTDLRPLDPDYGIKFVPPISKTEAAQPTPATMPATNQ